MKVNSSLPVIAIFDFFPFVFALMDRVLWYLLLVGGGKYRWS